MTTAVEATCDVGIVGLATMGSNLALNIAEKGFQVACFNRTFARTTEFIGRAGPLAANLHPFEQMADFVRALKKPRKVLILVQAGAATDSTILQLRGVLEANDIIVDTGNAHFKDQARRAKELEGAGLRFLGMGISGGEEGARKGPAFFPGGTVSVWEEIRPIVEAAAAKAEDGRPCVTMNGSGGAGSCVKMFHNAGEYAILQIWAEIFDILRATGMKNSAIAVLFEAWKKQGFLASYMLDISIEVCRAVDEHGTTLSDVTKDKIGSKGTGLWSAQEAMEIGVPAPSLSAAVISRQMTMFKAERQANAAELDKQGVDLRPGTGWEVEDHQALHDAAAIAIIASYAQMFQCLRELDKVHGFGLHLPSTIATFRAGCILKGYLLQPMTRAFEANPNLPNLMDAFIPTIAAGIPGFRKTMARVAEHTSCSTPVLSASLSYVNAMFSPMLKYGQMVALQRDVFGRHGFERLDKEGSHSHQWPDLQ